MRIAICGTHGVGKTTLAKWLGSELNLPVLSEQATKLLKSDFPFFETERDFRIFQQFQEQVLVNQFHDEGNHPDGFVADRSIIDSLAYVHVRTIIEKDFGVWLQDYKKRVEDSLLGRYDRLVFVRYDSHFLTANPEIRNMNPVFMEEIDRFIDYFLMKYPDGTNIIHINSLDKATRRKELIDWIKGA